MVLFNETCNCKFASSSAKGCVRFLSSPSKSCPRAAGWTLCLLITTPAKGESSLRTSKSHRQHSPCVVWKIPGACMAWSHPGLGFPGVCGTWDEPGAAEEMLECGLSCPAAPVALFSSLCSLAISDVPKQTPLDHLQLNSAVLKALRVSCSAC